MTLTMTRGLPASGKTTWAKQQNAQRINKDDLRQMLHNGIWSKRNEKLVLEVRDMLIRHFLVDHDVIVDDTNLAPKHEVQLRAVAQECSAEFVIKDFTKIPVETCIERDLMRQKSVGQKIIMSMWKKYLQPKPQIYLRSVLNPLAIICDLDGTLCLFGDKNPYDRNFLEDAPNGAVLDIVKKYADDGYQIIFTSGRNKKHLDQTKLWLKNNGLTNYLLYLREETDVRKDWIVKQEFFENNIQHKYNVAFVLDDRNQVVSLWRSLGLTCLQVADGDF